MPHTCQQKEQKEEEQKEEEKEDVVVYGLPRGGITIASAYGFKMKRFSMGEFEMTIKLGAALEETPIRPLGFAKRKFSWPPICVFSSN